jgi:hypothetical protein
MRVRSPHHEHSSCSYCCAMRHGPGDQLITDQPIALGRRSVHGQQQRELPLIDFINAQDPGVLLDNPRLVVCDKALPGARGATPAADAAFTGPHPEIAGKAGTDAAHGHAVRVDSLHRCGHDPVGVDRIGAQEGRLCPKVAPPGSTVIPADRDLQQHRDIKIKVDGDTPHIIGAGRKVSAAGTAQGREAPAHVADVAWRLVQGRRGRRHGTIPS